MKSLWRLHRQQLERGEVEPAVATLDRRLELADDAELQASTLETMAEIVEEQLADGGRALDLLRRALHLRPDDEDVVAKIRRVAERSELWEGLLAVHGERASFATETGNHARLLDVCTEASELAEDRLRDAREAFYWARRAYFVAVAAGRPSVEPRKRLEQLAAEHALWEELLAAIEEEIGQRGAAWGTAGDRAAKLITASDIARTRLRDPQRTVVYLQRAHALLPDDRDLAEQVEHTAQRYGLWPAVIELYERQLAGADTIEGRDAAYAAIARVYDDELDDPASALDCLLEAGRDFAATDPKRSADAFAAMLALAERHEMWGHVAQRHLDRAAVATAPNAQLAALRQAAHVFHAKMNDRVAAIQALAGGLSLAAPADGLLPKIRALAEELDAEQSDDAPSPGTVLWLGVLQLAARFAPTDDDRRSYVQMRARLREEKMGDHVGAMAEWLRVLRIDSEDDEAPTELERIAGETDLWPQFLALLGWQLERARNPETRRGLYIRLAQLYEGPLERPEYALRARLCAIRLAPKLPLTELHRDAICRLAEQTGDYSTPPTEGDELLTPSIRSPEYADLALWERWGLDPGILADTPSPVTPSVAPRAATGAPRRITIELSLKDIAAAAAGSDVPPPLPQKIDAGLPPVPRPRRTILPARPGVASAWEEVALACARLPDPARKELASLVPASVDVAEIERSHATLVSESAGSEQRAEAGLGLAKSYEATEDFDSAETCYRGVLAVSAQNVEALEGLCRVFEAQQRHAEQVVVYSALLAAQYAELDDNERVRRGVKLARLLSHELGEKEEAAERLDALVRQYPQRREIHDARIDLQLANERWLPAIDTMRVAFEAVDDPQYRLANLARIAEVYEIALALPGRAIEAWAEIADHGDDPHALAKLQALCLRTGRFEQALPIVERRLRALGGDDSGSRRARTALLAAKARALREARGDEAALTQVLEQLLDHAPDIDDVAVELSRLYRKRGRFDNGVDLLRSRWNSVDRGDAKRFVAITIALVDVLDVEAHDHGGALETIKAALEAHPNDGQLLAYQARLARMLGQPEQLAAALASLDDADGWLEAAELCSGTLQDPQRAARLYSRVLVQAKVNPEKSNDTRLAQSIVGLARLKLAAASTDAATMFIEQQLEEFPEATIRARLLTEIGRILYEATGNGAAAQGRFDAALDADPGYVPAKLGKAEILSDADELTGAEALLNDAVEQLRLMRRDDELVDALVFLAGVLERAGRSQAVDRRLTEAARRAPSNLEIHEALVLNRISAGRYGDAVRAADDVERRLAEGTDRTPQNVRCISRIVAMAGEAEHRLGRFDAAVTRHRRALELDAGNQTALEALVSMCREQGRPAEAARHARVLSRLTDDTAERGKRLIEAAALYDEAAQAAADGAAIGDETQAGLRAAALQHLRLGLDLVETSNAPVLDRDQAENAFRSWASREPDTALRCLEYILRYADVPADHLHDLLLEGARISLELVGSAEGAERYSRRARELVPGSAAALLLQARALKAGDRVDEIGSLVESYFDGLQGADETDEGSRAHVQLLLRLAKLQETQPEQAVAALERASELDSSLLPWRVREQIAALCYRAGIYGAEVIDNHTELLARRPLYAPSLAALARHHEDNGDLDRAYALYRVLKLVDADQADAAAFLARHHVVGDNDSEFTFDDIAPAPPASGGVPQALRQLWDGAAGLLSEQLPKVDVPVEARISPMDDNPLAERWSEMLRRIGRSKVALVDATSSGVEGGEEPDGLADGGFFQVRWQAPPVIMAQTRALASNDPAELRFALSWAMYFTQPEAGFAGGLRYETLAAVVSAMQRVFNAQSRGTDDEEPGPEAQSLIQVLRRKLPARLSAELTQTFEQHQGGPFDAQSWRESVWRAGNRIGLSIGGDIEAALRVVIPDEAARAAESLSAAAEVDERLRDLLVFATSEQYVLNRRKLGFRVQART